MYIKLDLICDVLFAFSKFCKLRKVHRHKVLIFMLLVVCAIVYYIIKINEEVSIERVDRNDTYRIIQESLQEMVLREKGTGCVMPVLDPFSEEAMRFDATMPKVICGGRDWVECYKSKCQVTRYILQTMRSIACTYRDIIYIDDTRYKMGEAMLKYGEEIYHLEKSDHVKVSCYGYDKKLSVNLMSSRWYGYKAGLRPVAVEAAVEKPSINLLVLAFDSTSLNGFIRRMPRTYGFLHEIGAVVMKRYNVAGDGTPAALYPILTGRMEYEMPDTRKHMSKNHVDHEQFLFHILKKNGYRTAYFEDMPWIGTFQNRYNGFSVQPADHYLRHFLMVESQNGRKWWHGTKGRHCIGDTPQYAVLLNLTRQFLDLQGNKFCFTFIADITHEDFNMISTADDDVMMFLKRLIGDGKLDDTLVIVMGDHGTRFNNIRETHQGRLEERLPLMALILPEKLTKSRPDASDIVRSNSEVLTTPFDVHATLLDAVNLGEHSNKFAVKGSDMRRGLTMLRPIPASRTCGEAGIVSHWCACVRWRQVNATDSMYSRAGEALGDRINSITSMMRSKCSIRKMERIEWVLDQEPNKSIQTGLFNFFRSKTESSFDTTHYQVKILMSPGNAFFEGTLRYDKEKKIFLISESDISRIDAYGDEPKCVERTHPHLKKYCYCLD